MAISLEQIKKQHPNIKAEDADDLKIINEALNGLFSRGTFASRDPYVLTIPQDEKFAYQHHSSRQARQFAHGTPFNEREREGLQYQTYKYYEPEKSLFRQYPSSDAQVDHTSKPKTMPSTAPKKVMSFGAYKKQKLGSSPPPKEQASSQATSEQASSQQAESADILAGVEEADATGHKEDDLSRHDDRNELKRKRQNAEAEPQTNGVEERGTPSKRQRLSDIQSTSPRSQPVSAIPSEDDSAIQEKANARRDLPRKLSPLPEKQLPNRLSPTLPNSIEDALSERRERKVRRKDSSTAHSDDASSGSGARQMSTKKQSLSKSHVSSKHASNGNTFDTSAKTKVKKLNPETEGNKKHPEISEHHTPQSRRQHAAYQSPTPNVVSKEQDSPLESKRGPNRDVDSHDGSKKKSSQGSKPPERPRTPVSAALVSPTMRRTLSTTNGSTTHTPSTETPKRASRPSVKNTAQQAWAAEHKRFEELGREMKHASTACAKTEPRLAAIHALESLMCYLLAFSCADQVCFNADEPRQPAPIKPWRSLGPFYQFVERACKRFPRLVGITGMLGLAFSAHILELLEASPVDMPSRETIIDITTTMRQAASQIQTNLQAEVLRLEFPDSWRVGLRHSGKAETLVAGRLLQGDFQLPTDLLTSPVHAVRAGLALLEEWIAQEGVDVKIELEPAT